MAGVSAKEIKNRIRSMESTKQITKAMEMVAFSKLRRAQNQVLSSRPYFEILYDTIQQILSTNRDVESPYLQARPVQKTALVVIAGDRGLAGGYNSNILKLVPDRDEEITVLPVGRKSAEYCKSRKLSVLTNSYTLAEEVSASDCFSMAKLLCKAYLAGKIDRIQVVYTKFLSVLSQSPQMLQLLPLAGEPQAGTAADILWEPSCEEVLAAIIPEYLGGVIYGCLCESRASEQAARRNAMDAATQNADEMIADLSLKFNRARQAAITQEITEIVAGS